jgi:thiol-disulfide isomerase/thioredoxin
MFSIKNMLSFLMLFSVLLAACSSIAPAAEIGETEPAAEVMMDQEQESNMQGDQDSSMASEDSMMESKNDPMEEKDMSEENKDTSMEDKDAVMADKAMVEMPAWHKARLLNVKTGETFVISDLSGKVILVETMATWCSNCLKQQQQVKSLHDLLGNRDDFISLGISVDVNEEPEALSQYTQEYGFDWLYTIASTDVAREISTLYGDQFLNPPSTPMLIIDRHGEVHVLPFGIKDAQSLYEVLQPFLESGM